MKETTRFRPNTPPVLHETLDNETILVNLQIGTYYSLNPVASSIWGAIDRGASVEEVIESIAEQSGAERAAVETRVRAFIEQLVSEQLLAPGDGDRPTEPVPADWADELSFEEPELKRYTDMQELLLLDPVHDVGVGGWPEPR
jgi:hypothetical protein